MANERYFTGFSTGGKSTNRSWVLYDIDLINQDLRYHFHTRKGERIMRPTYGCIIWDLINEQMSIDIDEQVKDEVSRIIGLDSRVENRGVRVSSSEHSILCVADLYYRKFDIVKQFKIDFDARQ